jgi:uncharacterized protein (TIGR04141 family)
MRKISTIFHLFFIWALIIFFSPIAYSVDGEHENIKTEFKFATLAHETGDPDSYTLACLDSNLIPVPEQIEELKKRKQFNPIRNWLRKELLEKADNEEASGTLHVETREHTDGSNYYLVRLYAKPIISSAEHFTTRIWGGSKRQIADLQYSASMLIFPRPPTTQALAYLFGGWRQLYNSHAVIHDWGLRLAATKAIFSDKNIKTLLGKNNFDSNPTSRKEKKQRLAPIESFALEVGTEGLQTLTVLPKYALQANFKRLVVGSDTYKFFLPEVGDGKRGDTISSLVNMANYLFRVYRDERTIHPKLQYYLDDEITDPVRIKELNKHLSAILTSSTVDQVLFPSDDIWKSYGNKPQFSYQKSTSKGDLFKVFKGKKITLNSLVSIKKARSKTSHDEIVSRLVYSLPIEVGEEFFRFDRGRWFKVASTRFNAIIRKMRDPDVKVNIETLLPYTLEDAIGEEDKFGGLYQEDRYNRRVVASLAGKKQNGVLLDRLNIYFSGKGNKFEFGDLLLYGDKGQNYIVHVKRKEAGDIDHHRAQVERCAEYLATELNKKNAKNILLLGCVNGLYIEYGVPITGKKTKHLTLGSIFKEKFTTEKRGKSAWNNYLTTKIFNNTKGEASAPEGKLRILLRKVDLSFFENHQEELIVALDALHDCCNQEKKLATPRIQEFFDSIRQLIEIREILLPSGVLTTATRKKTTIVLAVIDDRQIEPIRKADKALKEKKSKKDKEEFTKKVEELKAKDRMKEGELFHKQQLWGLDRTRQLVQKFGFKFNLVVINENNERPNWDAFGSTKVDTSPEDIDEDSDQKDKNHTTKKMKALAKNLKKKGKVIIQQMITKIILMKE